MRRIAAALATSLMFGCFDLKDNPDFDPNNPPEGYSCDWETRTCTKTDSANGDGDAAVDLDGGTSADASTDVPRDASAMEGDAAPSSCSAERPCMNGVCGLQGNCIECLVSSDCADSVRNKCVEGACVACTSDTQCPPSAPVCDQGACVGCSPGEDDCSRFSALGVCAGSGACVECEFSTDCADETKPHCGSDRRCSKCIEDADCSPFGKVCDESAGQCVECTPDSEVAQCPGRNPGDNLEALACDPVAKTCTGKPRGSVSGCGACSSDSECEEGSRCVSMTFNGQPYGNYCLQIAPAGLCPNRAAAKRLATSVLGVEDEYCFPNTSLTTCEAILDFKDECSHDADCGAPGVSDGVCVGAPGAKLCTYACDASRDCSGTNNCTGGVGSQYCNPN